jgi:hypothetical protein
MRWITTNLPGEKAVADRLRRSSKFYAFLWSVRTELFDDSFQDELAKAYEPRGQEPCPPAMLAMAMLMQRFAGLGDAATVDAAENDRRWQLVLGTLGTESAPFGQGSIVRFRTRSIEHDLDKKLVDRTVELAKRTRKYSWKRLKVALDSSPLEGAGRVEDTWNLIGRAMSKVVAAVAAASGVGEHAVIAGARLTTLEGPSLKAALDIDWSDPDERHDALQQLVAQAERLESWVRHRMKKDASEPPIADALNVLRRVIEQDLEPDPGGGKRIREGVAENRLISVGDSEMRHGRKSRTKTINGYKRHIIIANRFILGTAVEPANRREHEPTKRLLDAAQRHGTIVSAHFDRGYLPSPDLVALRVEGVTLHSRAWKTGSAGLLGKEYFHFDVDGRVVICPMGELARITPNGSVFFHEQQCARCPVKPQCTRGRRRSLRVHRNEDLLIELRAQQASPKGRAAYRSRTTVEHRLARVAAVQGGKARYKGVRKNELDLNRAAAVVNLQEIARLRAA